VIRKIRHIGLQVRQALPELLGLLRGDLPHFIYRAHSLKNEIPVFSFHSVAPSILRGLLNHLARNGYLTVSMDDLVDHLTGKKPTRPNSVVLTFDDGWSTAWTVATPMLKEFGMIATLYLAPDTVSREKGVRKAISCGALESDVIAEDCRTHGYLITWDELDAMIESGVWDVQSHTLSHSRVWSNDKVVDFVNPTLYKEFLRRRPWNIMVSGYDDIVAPLDMPWGWPIHKDVARMSAITRFIPDPQEGSILAKYAGEKGGASFFHRKDWRSVLNEKLKVYRRAHPGRWETENEMAHSLEKELGKSKEMIERHTAKTVRHLLFPWEEGSEKAIKTAENLGYRTAAWGVLRNRRSNYPGDDPYRIPRVSWKFLPLLPGEGRRSLSKELIRRVKARIHVISS
jgi:peptidoglycan/xylan/chitin deacetylase (PgdA/CDA1 family)